jgi:uncharacterized repeat protein (TIGR01451 family)
LAAVTVTDPTVSNLVCTPANGSSLAPGASLSCTATHTVTQADIDAGHYANQACVDDGAEGAAQACDSEDVPGSKNPHLTITKVATEASYSTVGQVIHYTIVATNDGNTTLAAVTVTDPNATGLTCNPANGSSLAPGASMTCTASHTITQANIDAGSYYNQACVDDGAGGAASVCGDVTTPGTQTPRLTIVKKTNGTDNNTAPGPNLTVGTTVTWTYQVTNNGNVTLTNVTVTDNKFAAANISCTGTPGGSNVIATLVPGQSVTCTATGVAVAGQYTNIGSVSGNPPTGTAATATDPDNYFGQGVNVSGSYPTATTCQAFIGNTVQPQEDGQYSVKGNKISQANPGVIFYYSRWTPQNATALIDQQILTSGFGTTMQVQQITLYRASNCSAAPGTATTPVTINVPPTDINGIQLTGLTVGLEYVVGVKYSVSSITGANAPTGNNTPIVWQFQTRENNVIVAKDANNFTLTKK